MRSYDEEMAFLRRDTPFKFNISKGFVPNMNVMINIFRLFSFLIAIDVTFGVQVEGSFYVNSALEELVLDELKAVLAPLNLYCRHCSFR